jgi:hypothetical protein
MVHDRLHLERPEDAVPHVAFCNTPPRQRKGRPYESPVSGLAHPRCVTTTAAEIGAFERLLDEIAAYLAVVDEFRTADAEPSWQSERQASGDEEGGEQ